MGQVFWEKVDQSDGEDLLPQASPCKSFRNSCLYY